MMRLQKLAMNPVTLPGIKDRVACFCGEVSKAHLGKTIVTAGEIYHIHKNENGTWWITLEDWQRHLQVFLPALAIVEYCEEGDILFVHGQVSLFYKVGLFLDANDASIHNERTEDFYIAKLESPIEKMFWEAARLKIPYLEPQFEVPPYRLDFAVIGDRIAIEIDGHDYHKTKEQRTHDAARDRFLQREGWRVMRFTGSEVFQNAERCVQEVLALLPSRAR